MINCHFTKKFTPQSRSQNSHNTSKFRGSLRLGSIRRSCVLCRSSPLAASTAEASQLEIPLAPSAVARKFFGCSRECPQRLKEYLPPGRVRDVSQLIIDHDECLRLGFKIRRECLHLRIPLLPPNMWALGSEELSSAHTQDGQLIDRCHQNLNAEAQVLSLN